LCGFFFIANPVFYVGFFFISDMRRDVQEIFRNTPHEKQVMMFSATLSKDIRPVCKKFMQDVGVNNLPPRQRWRCCSAAG
jgi:hypothetical protein